MTIQTRIADYVSNPGVMSNVVQATFKEKNSLITSGVAVGGPEVDVLMSGGSPIQGLNFVNKVDNSTFNYSSDDFDEKGATGKLAASPYMALRHDINWGWAYTDLVKLVTKYDTKSHLLANAIPLYWSEVSENLATASMKGVLAKTAALVTGTNTDTFNFNNIISAAATMDDPRSAKNLFVSRRTFAKLQAANFAASSVPVADANLNLISFAGYNVILTEAFGDNMTVIAQNGALAFSAGLVGNTIGMEIKRDADGGNGGGGEILRTRMSLVVAPQGYSYVGAQKPGLTGLATAANWSQAVTDLTLIGFRAIRHAA